MSFITKNFLKQLAQSHTFQYVSMSRREIGIGQSNIILFLVRDTFIRFFFLSLFSYVFGVFLKVTIIMALKFLTESSLYMVYLQFTEEKKRGPLD